MTKTSDSLAVRSRDRFIGVVLAWPGTVLAVFLLATALLGWQATRFEINASPDTLLTQDNELYQQTQEVNEQFSPQEFLLLIVEPRDGQVFSESVFGLLRQLSDELSAMDRVESVRSMLNVPIFTGAGGVDAIQADDLDDLTIAGGDFSMEQIEEAFTGHPIYEDLLVNRQQTAVALQVLFREMPGGSEAASEHDVQEQRAREVEEIRDIARGHEEEATLRLGGVHSIGYELIRIIGNDLMVFGTAIGLMICLLLTILFRGLRWVMIPMVCCAASVLSTMGLLALLGMKATVISSSFIALQLILTLAIVIHLIVQYRESAALVPDSSPRQLVTETLRRKVGPCFFAGLTTSVGFGSLVFSGIQPVIMFGWMMMIAMGVSLAVSLLLFPVLVELLPRGGARRDIPWLLGLAAGSRQLVLHHRWPVLLLSAALLVAGLAGATRLTVENSFINYFKPSTQVYRELAYIDQEFGGTTPLDLVYTLQERSENPDVELAAGAVTRMQQIQQQLNDYQATGRILSPVNLTDLARQVNNDEPLTEYELTVLYWMMEEELRNDLIGSFYDEDTEQVRFNIWIQDLTEGLDREQFLMDLRDDLAALDLDEESYTLSNLFVLYQDIMQRLFDSQLETLLIVYAAMAVVFLLIFGSPVLAVVALVPNMLSTAMIFGIMGWAGIPLDVMTITIAAIVMGIAVDDTIHYIHRYREERSAHSAADAVRRTHGSVGMAIIYTTLIIAAGFSLLGFSDFVPSAVFGLLTASAMLVALFADLCLLPVLLGLTGRQRRTDSA